MSSDNGQKEDRAFLLGLPSQALAWYCKTQTTQDMEALMVQ